MAVPKKRTSSSKTKSRHATWVNKAIIQRERAISLAKSVLNENSGSFIYSNSKINVEDIEELKSKSLIKLITVYTCKI